MSPTYGLALKQREHCVKVGLNTRFKKGQTPWIKGKKGVFKQSVDFKKYMSERMSGKNNPMLRQIAIDSYDNRTSAIYS